jgi:transposase-like protein
MARHRSFGSEFKRQIAKEFLDGRAGLHELARRHSLWRNLIRLWIRKYEAGEFTDELAEAVHIAKYESKIAELECKVGQLTMENRFAQKWGAVGTPAQRRQPLHCGRPEAASIAQGCPNHAAGTLDLLLPQPPRCGGEKVLHDRIEALCAEFPRDGYRRITHQLRAEGMEVNHKAVARLMRESGLQVRPLRNFVRTTDSNHDGPIFHNLVHGLSMAFAPTGPNQLWVGDIMYIRIAAGFVYLAVILHAWSRRVIGYALGR